MKRAILLTLISAVVLAGCTGAASSTAAASSEPAASGAAVVVFFGRADLDPCEQVVPVVRSVAEASPATALRALLAGPSESERAAGYGSWFSSATADVLVSVTVSDGTARVSLRDLRPIIPNASSSCGSGMLLRALDATLLQFPGVSRTRYSFEGDEAAFYEWLQMGVPES